METIALINMAMLFMSTVMATTLWVVMRDLNHKVAPFILPLALISALSMLLSFNLYLDIKG